MDVIEARHLVAGTWEGRPVRERLNPARPDDVVSISAEADAALVSRAIDAAVTAQPAWAGLPAPERGAILLRAAAQLQARATEIGVDLTREEGKTLAEATGEVRRAASILQFFGSEGWRIGGQTYPATASAETLIYTRKEPLGVVVAVTPWNFPIAIPTWKIAPALVAGNAVILKPAGLTPGTAWHLATALVDAGVPAGAFSLILGPGAEIGQHLVADPRVAAISFTGSIEVGDAIYRRAAPRRARVQLEMGGKNATVVLDDADPTFAARIVAAGGFGLTGQACTATSRVIATKGIVNDLVEALREEAGRFAPRDGLDEGALMGPVVSDAQLRIDRSYLDIARQEGAEVVTGADAPEGLFQGPAIVKGVMAKHRIAQEEVFGPVIAIVEVPGLDAAIETVNGTRFGLTASVVSGDLAAVQRFTREVRTGVIKVNQPTSGVELNVPFGGTGDSSTNTYREQGSTAVDFYTWVKSVYVTPPGWV
jgi:acyl-CoA reductase-like NAD-dependent aldehyde dehydrogenase